MALDAEWVEVFLENYRDLRIGDMVDGFILKGIDGAGVVWYTVDSKRYYLHSIIRKKVYRRLDGVLMDLASLLDM